MDAAHKKLNTILFLLIASALAGNSYMNTVELEAINKRLDEKHLLCLKAYEIQSKHNLVLKCDEVNHVK